MSMLKKKLNVKAVSDLLFQKGMNMRDLQKKANVSVCTVSQALTKGRAIQPKTAKRIADALNVDVLSILEEEPTGKGA